MRQPDSRLLPFPKIVPIVPLFAIASLSVPLVASADPGDVLRPYAAYTFTYDDNVLGLPSAQAAAETTGMSTTSDRSRSAQGGLEIDKTVGRQRLLANASINNVKYDRYTTLDYQGRDVLAEWDWHLGNHLEGAVKATYVRTLASFDDFHSLEKRLRTERRQDASVLWRYQPRWQVRAAVDRFNLGYSSQSQQGNDREEKSGEVGLDYITPVGSTVGILARRLKGTYPYSLVPNASASRNDFTQDEIRAQVFWMLTDRTQFKFSGGQVSRKHGVLVAKDFRGFNTRTSFDWQMTGLTVLNVAMWRELGVVDDLSTLYSLNKGVSLGPRWTVTSKVQADLQLRLESRDFRPSPTVIEFDNYGDVARSAQTSISYKPARHWLLQTAIVHIRRDGRGRLASFDRNVVNLTLQYQL